MKSPLRILHLEDNDNDAHLVERTLAAGGVACSIIRVATRPEFMAALEDKSIDLVLCDNTLPGFDGPSALKLSRKQTPELPFIFVTGTLGEEQAVESMQNGATDCVLKGHLLRLCPVVRRAMREVEGRAGNRRTEQDATRARQAETRKALGVMGTEQATIQTQQAEMRTEQEGMRAEQAHARTGLAEMWSEQTLQSSELSYRRLFEAARDGILNLDVETGRINDVNPFLVGLLGFSRSEMIGKTVGELSPFKDIERNDLMLKRLQKNGFVRYENLPLERRDGRKIAVEFVSNIYQSGAKRVIQCNIRDITERKRTEDQLNASIQEIRDLKSALDKHGIVDFTDPGGKITGVNDKFCAISKYSREELLGQDHRILNSGHHPKEFIRDLWSTITQGRVWQGEMKSKAKDGSFFWVDMTVVPFLDGQGKPRQYVAIRADITERKEAQEKIRQLNIELEQRVAERTAQLQAANEELESFSYSVSHDLRAPLRHVMGFADLLQQEAGPSLSEASLSHLKTIHQAAERMGELIDDLLAFSRAGRVELLKTDVNLDELVRETAGGFQADTKGRNITWQIHPLPAVRGDHNLLRQVLANLISNAVKFTGTRAEAKIEIGCAPATNGETVIFVRDNGAGFDPRYAHKLFGVFQRLHSAAEFEGTGIGLANVRRIIHRHGGRTWADGAVDGGATFYFSIPNSNGGNHEH